MLRTAPASDGEDARRPRTPGENRLARAGVDRERD